MSDITLSDPALLTQELLMAFKLATSVHAGFPSPAAEFSAKRIDIMDRLVVHPQATNAMRVSGESMRELGIFDGGVLLVDKAVKPRHGMVVIAIVDGDSPASSFTSATDASSSRPPTRPTRTSRPKMGRRSRSGAW